MKSKRNLRFALRAPTVLLVLAATAVPVEMRQLAYARLDFEIFPADVALNVAGYVPIGLVLLGLGSLWAIIAAALISTMAEVSQFAMMYRDPSATDILANTIGAALGVGIGAHWRIGALELNLNRWTGWGAIGASVAVFWALNPLAAPINARGYTLPGTLEAHWKLDEASGTVAEDSSQHGLTGSFHNSPTRVAGVLNRASAFDGAKDSIDFDVSESLRLAGSMTVTAWISSSNFPHDDAAIVSQFSGHAGYQIDTTVDNGPRTIGFKLTDENGNLMARYGATSLQLNAWHHIAGVYDASARTLDVYLDGELNNGLLLGNVTSRQRGSRAGVSLGRRRDAEGFEFAGSVDDVQIYSLALTKAEIWAVMRGESVDRARQRQAPSQATEYVRMSDEQDTRVPLGAAALGALTAIAFLSLWPSAARAVCLLACLFAGLPLLPSGLSHLPLFNLWLIPLVSLASGASVTLAARSSP